MDNQPNVPDPAQPDPGSGPKAGDRHPLLLIEDDPADAARVDELLSPFGDEFPITWVRTIEEAGEKAHETFACCLLDLGLPDAAGLESVKALVEMIPDTAIIVLTGGSDWKRGVEALSMGAHDYLVKDSIDQAHFAWTIRFAAVRRRVERVKAQQREDEIRSAEAARLERGLLPNLLVQDAGLTVVTRYRPGGNRPIIGGDFLDAVRLDDGTVRMVIGDVSGHGPDQAAVGVALRIAWRTLVLSGHSHSTTLQALDRILRAERPAESMFATVCDVAIAQDRSRVELRIAGHPSPISLLPTGSALGANEAGPPLGVVEQDQQWPASSVDLPQPWALLLVTDGLIEGGPGNRELSLGLEGLIDLASSLWKLSLHPTEFVDFLIEQAEAKQGGSLPDDVAVALIAVKSESEGAS